MPCYCNHMAGRNKEEKKVRRTLKLSQEPADQLLDIIATEKGLTRSAAANLILNSVADGDYDLLKSLTKIYRSRRQF